MAQDAFKFLGYEIEKEKLRPDNTNIEFIKKLKAPKNTNDFPRILNKRYKFIPNYAKLKGPLNRELSKKRKMVICC